MVSMKWKIGTMILSLSAAGLVSAQTAGTWMLKGGYNEFYPHVKSDDITGVPGGKIDVAKAGNLIASVAYMLNDQLSTEFTFGTPPNHDISGAGTLGSVGEIASADILPAALAIQYRFFQPNDKFRPYVGLGVVRAIFRNVQAAPILTLITNPAGPATTVSIDSAWGVAGQIGFTYALSDKWFLDGAIDPMLLKTTARLSTGQSVDVAINPVGVNLSMGYRF